MATRISMEELDIDQERLQVALAAMRRNNAYFLEHIDELFEQCPQGWILIFGDQQVETYDEFLDAAQRRRGLDQPDRDGSIVRHQLSGTWIL